MSHTASPAQGAPDALTALEEVSAALQSIPAATLDEIANLITNSGVVASYAGGREGLAMKGLTMRLFHAGVDAHSVGEMTCPAVGRGDLLVLSCGPGNISTVAALAGVARSAGAKILYFTAEPDVPPADLADVIVRIDAQTMARDTGSPAVLPMGSSYEVALFLVADLITNRVRTLRAESPEQMRSRHTNLE
ncbi:MAG: SIS domain-containing protein [Leucobacter sp.]